MKYSVVAALAAVGSVAAVPSPVADLAPRASASSLVSVTTQGNAFFAGNDRFYIRGVDYQPGGSSQVVDPIANEATCTRDISYFKQLGINTVRVYTVDNTANHDACMNALAAAGIYLVLDVNTPKYSLNRAQPAPSYNALYLQNIFATIDAFAKYNNTLAFFSGNEVINDDTTTGAAPYVKAVTRDMRQYIQTRGYRQIPVGYSAADVDSNRMQMAEFMNCGPDNERSDFFAFNDYSWCDPSSFTQSGWDQKVKNFTDYGIPIFLSEYGCITNGRQFQEVAALYNTEMTVCYSGGLVYEYSQEGNGYGLVTINGNTVTPDNDFTALQKAYSATPNPTGTGNYNPQNKASTCPPASASWNVTSDNLPALPSAAADLMKNGAGQGAGLGGAGSQDAGSDAAPSGTSGSSSSSTGTSSSSSSSSTSDKSSGSKSAGTSLQPVSNAPFVIGFVTVACTFLGAALL